VRCLKDKEEKVLLARVSNLESAMNALQIAIMKLSETGIANVITQRVQMQLIQALLVKQAMLDARSPEAQEKLAKGEIPIPQAKEKKVGETYVS